MAKDFILKIEKFSGLHTSPDPATSLAVGESPDMLNLKVTSGYRLKKREGFSRVYQSQSPLRGFWNGKVKEKEFFLAVEGTKLLISPTGFDSLSPLSGEVPGEGSVCFFPFYDGVYLLTGEGIRRFDGETLSTVEPHVPLVMVATTPQGAGTSFEEVNLLTRHFRQSFSPTGEDIHFYPILKRVVNVRRVTLEGTEVSPDQYCWDAGACRVTFLHAPPKGTDTLEIWLEGDWEDVSHRIWRCRYGVGFGGANDTRVFLYGNPDTPAMRYHSGVVDGKPTFAYFPETGYSLVGTGSPITSILRHYDRLLIFTESAAYYSYLEYMTGENGKLVASFPILPLSDDRGSSPMGQSILVENTPCTLTDTGLFRWTSTNIRDERNAQDISDPIAHALQKEDSRKAILFHRKATSEVFVCFDGRLFVYQYRLGLFYYHQLPPIRGFWEVEKELYFYTDDGIFLVGGTQDDGQEIPVRWESGLLSFQDPGREKNIFGLTVLGEVDGRAEAEVTLVQENGKGSFCRRVVFPWGKESSHRSVRLPMRRIRLLKVGLETKGSVPLSIRGFHIKGRMSEKR